MSEAIAALEKKRDEHVLWTAYNFGSKSAAEVKAIYDDGIAAHQDIETRKFATLNANPQLENFPFAEVTQ